MNEYCVNIEAHKASSNTKLEDLNFRVNEVCELANIVENSYSRALVRNLGENAQEISKEDDVFGLIDLMITRMNYIELVLKSAYAYLERV